MTSNNKNMTIDDLATIVTEGFGRVDKRFEQVATKAELDDLAVMVANGFERTGNDILEIKQDVGGLKQDVGGLKKDVGEIKLAMDDMDKKIDKLDFKIEEVRDAVIGLEDGPILDLQKRVQVLEKTAHSQ